MFRSSYFRRRVYFNHQNQALHVHIAKNNNRASSYMLLVISSLIFVWLAYLYIKSILHFPFEWESLYVLPFLAGLFIWYTILLRVSLWRAFGFEEILISNGQLKWTRSALIWIRKFEVPVKDITSIRAYTPWHALSNCVEFTVNGKPRRIGDMLLRDETIDLAKQMTKAIGVLR